MKFINLFSSSFVALALFISGCKKDNNKSPEQGSSCQLTVLDIGGQSAVLAYDEADRLVEVQGDVNYTLTYESGRILISDGSHTNSYTLNANGLVVESTVYEGDQPFTGRYTYENGYLAKIEYEGEPVYQATITFEYENGNISNIVHNDEFAEEPLTISANYQSGADYVPYSILATDLLVFWAQEQLLYEQGYMGKIIKNRIQATSVDELVYNLDNNDNIVGVENIAAGKSSHYINYDYLCN